MMKSPLIFSALVAATGIAGAQDKTVQPDSSCTKYSNGRIECRVYRRVGPDSLMRRMSFRMDSVFANRAALGIEVRSTGNKRDTLGVFVEGVTSKGPAEAAGIVEGDRIASINGVDLRTPAADADDEFDSGIGARRLSREVQKLTPGARVALRVYSGGRFRDVQVTAGKASDLMRLRTANFRSPGGGFEFYGPDRMFGPDTPMMYKDFEPLMLEQMQPMLERMQPMLEHRLRDLPERIEMHMTPGVRTFRMLPRTYRVDRGTEELRAAAEQGFIH
jgi:PDZ domain